MQQMKAICLAILLGGILQAEESERLTWVWFNADYLYWWVKDSPATVPLIVSGSDLSNLAPALHEPNTKIAMGNEGIGNSGRSGAKFSLGGWVDSHHIYSIEAGYLFLCNHTNSQIASSTALLGSQDLAFPFFDPVIASESAALVADFDNFSGVAKLQIKNSMQDAEFNGFFRILHNPKGYALHVFSGFFWWNFHESLLFTTSSPFLEIPTSVFQTDDQFQAHNNFYGGQVGLRSEWAWQRFFLRMRGQIAIGGMKSDLNIKGQLLTNDFNGFGILQTYDGGYTALSTNEGSYSQTRFSIIPQFNMNLGYNFTNWLNLHAGYTFLYATSVMWATNQIDSIINPSQSVAITANTATTLVGAYRPQALLETAQFWAQGINVGLQLQF